MLALRDTGGKSWKLTQEGEEVLLVQDLGLVVEAAEVELHDHDVARKSSQRFRSVSMTSYLSFIIHQLKLELEDKKANCHAKQSNFFILLH